MRFFPAGKPACRLTLLPLLTLIPDPALAAGGADAETAAYFRLLWGLLIVLAVVLILYALVKKRFSLFTGTKGGVIKVIEMRPLLPKKSLCLVEVRGKEFLLGISNEQIALIAALDGPAPASFAAVLKQSRNGTAQP